MSLPSQGLDAFHAVAQLRHFTKAAERLHITQSALSQRIANLEQELGTTLFIRDRAGLRLTEAGEELLRYCQMRHSLEEELMGRLTAPANKEGMTGVLRIGGFSSVMRSVILPALAPLLSENPRLRFHSLTKEMYELPDLLRTGEIEYMILDHKLERKDIESVELGTEEDVLVMRKNGEAPDIYLDHDEEDVATLRYLKIARTKSEKLERRYLDDVYGLLDGVRLGLGKAVLPRHLVKGDARLRILQPERVLKVPVILHFHRQPCYSALHEKVVSALVENSKRLLDAD